MRDQSPGLSVGPTEGVMMQMAAIPFGTTDWSQLQPNIAAYEVARIGRTQHFGNIRARMVEYSPGYRADHWRIKGHILLRTQGELHTELEDGHIYVEAGHELPSC